MKIITQFSRLMLLLSIITLTACGDEQGNSQNNETKQPVVQTTVQETESAKSEYPAEPRVEVYGDKTIWSTPRIQFLAKIEGEEKSSIWSMRLDGSDRRRAAGADLLFNGGIVHKPVRSPNNRYIAVSMATREGARFRAVIDLKEQVSWKIHEGSGYPNFNFSSDSSALYFSSKGVNFAYDMASKVVTKAPAVPSNGYFLLADDKTFLGLQHDGYWLYNLQGEILKKVVLDLSFDHDVTSAVLSPDKKNLVIKSHGGTTVKISWVDLTSHKKIGQGLAEDILGSSGKILVMADKKLTMYLYNGDRNVYVDLLTQDYIIQDVQESEIWGMYMKGNLSLINYQTSQYYQQ
ncbi:MAG: hypothetical protein GY787_32830 [Alteromonadales bacterium]|nr:hypothetical protein [Alteromonadales bacterium]